jgi:hypothetical protein
MFYQRPFWCPKNTTSVDILLLKFKVMWSISLVHWRVVLQCARKTNWLALSRSLSWVCLGTTYRMPFSKSLPIVDKKLIEHKFWGNLGSLPGCSSYNFCKLPRNWKTRKPKAVIKWMCQTYHGLLGGACGIHLECHQLDMPFYISRNLLISLSHKVLLFHRIAVYSFEQS